MPHHDCIRVVATGDSMTEGAGPAMPALAELLRQMSPQCSFDLVNQAVGGTRAGYALRRLTNSYEHGGRTNPPLVALDPDIVMLESFAYNNGADGATTEGLKHFREMHWRMLSTLREKTRAELVFVVTIAPDPEHFLETVPNFVHTPVAIRRRMAEQRIVYLEEAVRMAEEWELPLANAYQASLTARDSGTPLSTFISPDDWIHPGPEGHALVAREIVAAIQRHDMISCCREAR